MTERRNALTPEALAMMDSIARNGSFAAAARELGKVPSALTYSVRQLEDALDVLLFDRRSGQAQLTAAGDELLNEGRRLLAEIEAVANRVRRVACGWETQLTVVADGVISRLTLFELSEAFYALRPQKDSDGDNPDSGPGTRLRLRTEVLAGTWEALLCGEADLAIGVGMDGLVLPPGVELRLLGEMGFVFAVAPHHPLAAFDGAVPDHELLRHRAVAVADSARRHEPHSFNLLPGQEVFTVASVQAKVQAQLRCLGCGFLPEPLAREHIRAGRLVVKAVQRATRRARLGYAWRENATPQPKKAPQGLALAWWLEQLSSKATRKALLERHTGLPQAVDG
ncbi:MAG: LysR family transcriptional regulator [Burkholderiaceae bacterium]|nr:LysR family transcriptional regulator [Burkholderiaceae bacterium]